MKVKIHIKKKIIASLFLLVAAQVCFAKPLFMIAANFWTETAPIFLANVNPDIINAQHKIKQLKSIKLKTEKKPDTEILAMTYVGVPKNKHPSSAFKGFSSFVGKNKHRKQVIYALASQGLQRHAFLYQLDAMSGEEITACQLPCSIESGYLHVEDVYFANAWHSILMIDTKKVDEPTNLLLVLDITNPEQFKNKINLNVTEQIILINQMNPTKPLNQDRENSVAHDNGSEPPNRLFVAASKPKIICNKEGEWGIIQARKIAGEGYINIISFESPHVEYSIKINQNVNFQTLIPIDVYSQGFVDKIYAWDNAGHIWAGDISNPKATIFQKIIQKTITLNSEKCYCLNSASGHGIELLALEKEGLVVYQPDSIGSERIEMKGFNKKILAKGSYLDFFLAAGYLILIPKSSNQKPELFARIARDDGYEKINADWQNLLASHSSAQEPIQAEFIWDFKQKQMKMIVLYSGGQLNILSPILKSGRIGGWEENRVVWRNVGVKI